ncbi:MAG: helix-turn-helix domain-containing protein [Marinilabiliaceae bacterium]|nr:helix-turn-helix domain-containing protein [Marinilabiliaceae bacterium]
MEHIPDINFRQKKSNEMGFEIMSIHDFRLRGEVVEPKISTLHRVHFHLLMFFTKGSGSHLVDFKSYDLKKGDLLIITKEQVQAFNLNQEQEGYIILFTDQFLNKNLSQGDYFAFYRFFAMSKYPPIIGFDEKELVDLTPCMEGMVREYNREDNFAKVEIVRSLLKILLLSAERMARHNIQQPNSAEFKTFMLFQNLLSKEYTKTRDAIDYASTLNISYRQLNDICKEFTQKTAKAVIDGFVILEAKRKLSQIDLPIKEISYSLGFDEPTNFVKYFKKQTRLSPKLFREQISG